MHKSWKRGKTVCQKPFFCEVECKMQQLFIIKKKDFSMEPEKIHKEIIFTRNKSGLFSKITTAEN